MITNRHLVHALALARHRNFRRAAQSLHITQPALTRSIQGIEQALGVRLFDRRSDGVDPTAFGDVLIRRAGTIVSDTEELLREIRLMQDLSLGELRIASAVFPTELSVHAAVGRLARAHPQVRCRIRIGDWSEVTESVLRREADIGLAEVSEADKHAELATQIVARHRFVFFCRAGHPLSSGAAVSFDDVFSYPFATTKGPPRMTRLFPSAPLRAGRVDPETGYFIPAIEIEYVSASKKIVEECDVLGVACLGQIVDELEAGSLAVVPFTAPWMQLGYGFIYLRDRTLAPSAEMWMHELRAVESEIVEREARLWKRHGPDTEPARPRAGSAQRPGEAIR